MLVGPSTHLSMIGGCQISAGPDQKYIPESAAKTAAGRVEFKSVSKLVIYGELIRTATRIPIALISKVQLQARALLAHSCQANVEFDRFVSRFCKASFAEILSATKPGPSRSGNLSSSESAVCRRGDRTPKAKCATRCHVTTTENNQQISTLPTIFCLNRSG